MGQQHVDRAAAVFQECVRESLVAFPGHLDIPSVAKLATALDLVQASEVVSEPMKRFAQCAFVAVLEVAAYGVDAVPPILFSPECERDIRTYRMVFAP